MKTIESFVWYNINNVLSVFLCLFCYLSSISLYKEALVLTFRNTSHHIHHLIRVAPSNFLVSFTLVNLLSFVFRSFLLIRIILPENDISKILIHKIVPDSFNSQVSRPYSDTLQRYALLVVYSRLYTSYRNITRSYLVHECSFSLCGFRLNIRKIPSVPALHIDFGHFNDYHRHDYSTYGFDWIFDTSMSWFRSNWLASDVDENDRVISSSGLCKFFLPLVKRTVLSSANLKNDTTTMRTPLLTSLYPFFGRIVHRVDRSLKYTP